MPPGNGRTTSIWGAWRDFRNGRLSPLALLYLFRRGSRSILLIRRPFHMIRGSNSGKTPPRIRHSHGVLVSDGQPRCGLRIIAIGEWVFPQSFR